MPNFISLFLIAVMALSTVAASAETYSYHFNSTPLSTALTTIDENHPEININFIHNELENYRTSAHIHTNDPYKAIQQAIGFNNVNITRHNNIFYVEAQQHGKYCYKGKVSDCEGEPVIAAAVMIFSSDSLSPITYGVTDLDGTFIIPCDRKNILIKINSLGYEEYTSHSPAGGNFGTIVLKSSPFLLDEIVVKANLPATQLKGNALVTTIENSVLSKMGTADDVLEHIPLLSRNDGSFQVFGRGKATIYINGKLVRDKIELEQLKSDNIRSIEVISNPGASYSSDVRAVIKIKTLPIKGDGFGLDVSNRLWVWKYARNVTDLTLNYRHNNLEVFGTAYIYEGKRMYEDTSETTTFSSDNMFIQSIDAQSVSSSHNLNGKLGFSYLFGSSHSLGAYYKLSRSRGDNVNSIDTKGKFIKGGLETDVDAMTSDGIIHSKTFPSQEANIYYNGYVGKSSIDFNADFIQQNYYKNDSQTEISQSDGTINRQIYSSGLTRNRLLAEKLILSHPIWKGVMEIGEEFTDTKIKYDYNYEGVTISGSAIDIRENNIAAFATLSQNFGKWDISAGLRYEHVKYKYYEGGKLISDMTRQYNNIFPSLSVSTKFNRVSLSFDFTNKTRRPSYSQLDGNISYINRYIYQAGNPTLKPVKMYTLQSMASWKYFYAQASYVHEKDAIFNIAVPYKSDQLAKVLTSTNVPHFRQLQFTVGAQPTFGIWHTTPEIGIIKQFCHINYRNKRLSFGKPLYSFTWDNVFSLPYDWQIGTDIYIYSAGNSQNSYLKPTQQLNMSVRKSFLNDNLSLQFQAIDILDRGTDRITIYCGDIKLYMHNHHQPRYMLFSVRYKFNKTRSKYLGTGAGKSEKRRL